MACIEARGESRLSLALVEEIPGNPEAERRLRQAQKLEAVGRLAGRLAHDFNNLLTGVLLYRDLLMADPVRPLLMLARPTSSEARLLSLNEIAEGMRNVLLRLIGEEPGLSRSRHGDLIVALRYCHLCRDSLEFRCSRSVDLGSRTI